MTDLHLAPAPPGVGRGTTVTPRAVPFAGRLGAYGDRVALHTPDGTLTYTQLSRLVDDRAAALGSVRRLVAVAGSNRLGPLVTYLAALSAGHPVMLVPGDNAEALARIESEFDPDVVVGPDGQLAERRRGTGHDLHPELALLLTTSGSTGSAKLVRLSADNLQANADSIAQYLRIRPSDVAATTLPLHYCYGLSVINSHLLAGASLLLTSRSVAEDAFWSEFRAIGGTTFAGVPYTFDLLDRCGFADMDLPSLRYVTQAGGRLAPDRVRRYATVGRRQGWDLVVMYGQTEATARMAYLPPDLALSRPEAIGVPIPGGAFRIQPIADPAPDGAAGGSGDVGELVYEGPNVMLGYAESPADLALGRTTTSLRTGDLARRAADGLYEIVGRRSRFAKIFGRRLDLDDIERRYAASGIHLAAVAAHDPAGEHLVLAVADAPAAGEVSRILAMARRDIGLSSSAVSVCPVRSLPRLANGKPDYQAVAALATPSTRSVAGGAMSPGHRTTADRLRQAYADVLGRDDVCEEDSFVALQGDSLSYVELSLWVEETLGYLPAGWHTTPIGRLALPETSETSKRRRRGTCLETNVLLRALAIVLVVGSHANLFTVLGGAHVLLGAAGFNFGRFHLTTAPRLERLRHVLSSVARVALPAVLWIGLVASLTTELTWKSALLLNGVLGSPQWNEPAWHYWFVEALVYTLLASAALLAFPAVDRIERRWPFWFPMALAGLGLLTRYGLVDPVGGDVVHRAHIVFWLFALGWATAKATRVRHRVLISVVVLATVPGFFGDAGREAVVVTGLLALIWVRSVTVPSWLARVAGVLASSSLYIYLIHWQIYPHLEYRSPWLATLLSLLVGIAAWKVGRGRSARALLDTALFRRPSRCRSTLSVPTRS